MAAAQTTATSPVRRLLRPEFADFWRLWSVGLVVFVVRWLETVAVGVVVYQRTNSAFLVSMMTMLRLLPMGLFGAFLGAWAERIERRTTLICVVLSMGGNSAILGALAYTGNLEVWHLALSSFVNGLGWATDNPLRRTMMGEVVGRDRMATAMAFDVGAANASRMVGPAVGGLLLAGVGIEGAFALSVAMYATAIAATLAVRSRMPATPGSGAVFARTRESVAIVMADRRLGAIMVVTIIYNVFAWPFTSMIPVIGRDQLRLGPEGVGLLTSVDGVGAFAGALLLALWLVPGWHARAYVGGTAAYLVGVIAFALSGTPLLAGVALLVT
ncbi:MAG: MFS transporter, partial [Rhodospirillales bacterium]